MKTLPSPLMNEVQKPLGANAWLILLLLSFIWGSSFILIKKSLLVFTPLEIGALRVVITSLAFLPVIVLNFKKIDWTKWKKFLIIGIIGSALPSILFALAQTKVSSSVAGVLNSMTPVFALIFGVVIFKTKVSSKQIAGVFIGFLGATLLLLGDRNAEPSLNFMYGLLIILATISYAYNANAVQSWFKQTSPVIISSVSFSLLGPFALMYVLSQGIIERVPNHEYGWYSLGAVAFLALVGTALSTIIFFKLIQDTSALFGSSVAFVIPIFAVFWGMFDGETFFLLQVCGMLAILGAIYLIREKKLDR